MAHTTRHPRLPFPSLAFWLAVLLSIPWFSSNRSAGQEAPDPTRSGGGRWLAPDGRPSTMDGEAMLAFLQTAEIRKLRQLGGTNRPWKVELQKGGHTIHGVFRTIELKRSMVVIDGERYDYFRDSHLHECAAYVMSQLLAIPEIPPCVRRIVDGEEGTLQLWIEEAMTDRERRQQGLEPPSTLEWIRSKQNLRLFDALIANIDRNQGNMLVDSRGRLWLIDHTRAFGSRPTIENVERVVWCERDTWRRLRALDRTTLEHRLEGLLESRQMVPLLARRDQLVAHLEQRIAELGEGAVLYERQQTQDRAQGDSPTHEGDFPLETSLPD